VVNNDFALTFADIAGIEPPDFVDGRSFLPLFGDDHIGWRRNFLIRRLGLETDARLDADSAMALRTDRWSFVTYSNGQRELYDLREDPHQLDNIVDSAEPALLSDLTRQSAGLSGQKRNVVQGIVDRVVAAEGAIMAPNYVAVLPAFQAVGIGADLDRPPDRTGVDRVPVLVEPHETGFGHRRRHSVESVERTDIGHKARTLVFGHLPDRLVWNIGVSVRPGIGDAPILEPGVQLHPSSSALNITRAA